MSRTVGRTHSNKLRIGIFAASEISERRRARESPHILKISTFKKHNPKTFQVKYFMGVSKNNGTPKSSHFNRVFSIVKLINHPFWGTPIVWKRKFHWKNVPIPRLCAPNASAPVKRRLSMATGKVWEPMGVGRENGKKMIANWWFQIFFIFTPIWGNDPF